jgi:hypothetical protein
MLSVVAEWRGVERVAVGEAGVESRTCASRAITFVPESNTGRLEANPGVVGVEWSIVAHGAGAARARGMP